MSILFSDIDGTLLNDDRVISEYTLNVIKRMIDEGHKLVLTSGRPLTSVKEVLDIAGINYPGMYIIAYNGCVIYDCDNNKYLKTYRVPMDILEDIWKIGKEYSIHTQTYLDEHIYVASVGEEIKGYTTVIHMDYSPVDKPLREMLHDEPIKALSISFHEEEKHEDMRKEVLRRHGDRICALFSNPWYVEYFSNEAGKGTAARWLCEYLGTPLEDSYGAGDEMNDLSLIEGAGHGVAMKNGRDELKRVAEYVTEYTNHEDGLAKFIEKYIL